MSNNGWISTAVRMPKQFEVVLIAGRMKYDWEEEYTRFVDLGCYNGLEIETENDWYEGQDEFKITHWMPLPDHPEEVET